MCECLGLTQTTSWVPPYFKPSKASSEKSSKLQTYTNTWAPPYFEAFSEKAVFEIHMLPVSCPVSFKSKSKTNNGLYISGTGFGYHQNATHTFAEIARDEE